MLPTLTREEREIVLEKAKQSKLLKKEQSSSLDQNWGDLPHWKELASKYDFRLPIYYQPCSETKFIKRLFKKVDIDILVWLNESCGCTTLKQLVSLNPSAPAYAMCGWALEYIDETKNVLGNSE